MFGVKRDSTGVCGTSPQGESGVLWSVAKKRVENGETLLRASRRADVVELFDRR